MIDSHAHLHDAAFDEDRDAMIARAHEAGVTDFINIGTDLASSAQAIACANAIGAGVAIGIHPHEAIDAPGDLRAAFAPLIADARRLVAIGEIGLDYHYDHSPRDVQRDILRAQLALAADHNLPVIFHEREALDDFTDILSQEYARREAAGLPKLRGIVHCFTRDLSAARRYVDDFGLFLGIGGVVTFRNAQALRDAVSAVGLAHIVLETDCPYLAPIPHRGRRNEPAFLHATASALAVLLETDLDTVGRITDANLRGLLAA